jgi:hypothetical protein
MRRASLKGRAHPLLSREEFAKISEVEGMRLTEDMKRTRAEFHRLGLPPEERRRLIIERFKRAKMKLNIFLDSVSLPR